jgi:hypothetical protein
LDIRRPSWHLGVIGKRNVHPAPPPMENATMTDLTKLSQAELIALLQAAQAVAQAPKKITLKVSEKGGLSLYGLGRFPVTLYRSQWERLLTPDTVKQVQDFIKVNSALLTVKA